MTDVASGAAEPPAEPPNQRTWVTWREARGVVLCRSNLCATTVIAAIVGTMLLLINQLDVLLQGHIGAVLLVKAVLTYLIPFLVSNYGVLVATRRRPGVSDRWRR